MMFDETRCELGEGPLWHPGRQSLFWFDILNRRMYERPLDGETRRRDFDDLTSAAGIIDDNRLLVASEKALSVLDLTSGTLETVTALEADNPVTRSNDGRADPQGGFWIGTMGKQAQPKAGSIWRFHRGELRRLFPQITITNSICFSPDGQTAYFADTAEGVIQSVALDGDGWPASAPQVFADLRSEGLNPDGAVVDAEGCLWSAQWGASRVARYAPDGRFLEAIEFPVGQISCPAFGGADLATLFATSAYEGLAQPGDQDGCVFAAPTRFRGQAEHRVIL